MKKLVLIIFAFTLQSATGQIVDTINLNLNKHISGKNYLSWSGLADETEAFFIVEKRDCDSKVFIPHDVINRPIVHTDNSVSLGFWWNETGIQGCDYRVLLFKLPK